MLEVCPQFSGQIFRRDQLQVVVVGRLQTVVTVTAVAQQLETLCFARVACQLGLVPPLQDWQQVVRAPVAKFVRQKMGYTEMSEASLLNQPPQVSGGHRLRVEEGGSVQRPGRLAGQVVGQLVLAVVLPAKVIRHLSYGSL